MIRHIMHVDKPFAVKAENAFAAAESYLREHGERLGLGPKELESLRLRPQTEPTNVGVEDRLLSEKRQFDTTTITFQQTCLGLPVWQAGTSVHLKHLADSFEVISSHTTRHDEIARWVPPNAAAVMQSKSVNEQALAGQLGITKKSSRFDAASLRICHQGLMIYRYEAKKRFSRMPLPPVPSDIVNGSYNVVLAVYFDIKRKRCSPTHWVALVEVRSLSVLYLEELAAGVSGMVFLADPMTTNGGPLPSATNAELNPLRVLKTLPNLDITDPQKLVGSNVNVSDFESPHNTVPTENPNTAFEFDVRTNEFAAVNAYFNCDRFFGLLKDLGFDRDTYFTNQRFPIKVDPRGIPDSSGGDPFKVGAQTNSASRAGPHGNVITFVDNVIFSVADENEDADPLGLASDWRVVLHELGGHATLLNHINSAKFNFAHSAGDSFAAILNDPESKAQDKGQTFPWVFSKIARRHDREAAKAWGWGGKKDKNNFEQLEREQILSSTHFRFYKAIGGSDAQLSVRQFAARYAVYLILRAIQTLTPATNPHEVADWFCSLIAADSGDWTSERQSGGAYAKVLRWAFEKQGLFKGKPPDVDVYIDDGRKGEYTYNPDYAKCPAIWNRNDDDDEEGHQAPMPNAPNFAYVKIKNRGRSIAHSVSVDAYQAKAGSALVFPDDWEELNPPQRAVPNVPARSKGTKAGPFRWIPTEGSNAILMAVSATGDPNNLGKFRPGKPIPDGRLVPNDNNLGMRKF
jgi:zinc metalloprotease ZmpB